MPGFDKNIANSMYLDYAPEYLYEQVTMQKKVA
jgi:hypothetical protein